MFSGDYNINISATVLYGHITLERTVVNTMTFSLDLK